MSWDNQEKCPMLKRAGVQLNQSAYNNPLGRPARDAREKRNGIKEICLCCPVAVCVYQVLELPSEAR